MAWTRSYRSKMGKLSLDGVLPLEHLVNLLEVVGAREDPVGGALGLVALLEMSLLAEVAHLMRSSACFLQRGARSTYVIVGLRGNDLTRIQALVQVDLLNDVLGAAIDLEGEQRRGETTAVAENTNTLALELVRGDVAEQADKTAPHATAVHVTAHGGNLNGGLDAASEALLGLQRS